MNTYDFKALHDKEFEVFCTDLLSAHFKTRIERFKAGKDGGVDGRFYESDKTEVILQYKHRPKITFAALLSHLKKDELPKIAKLTPRRYLLAVSHSLSKGNKASIMQALSPNIRSESDILGAEDLNDILRRYPEIEANHYKLWLASSNVLSAFLNNAVKGRSAFFKNEILEESKKYVITSNYKNAMQKLEKLHNVIITGAPGIGKTTLANQLALYYASEGYEIINIEDDFSEAESIFSAGEKQLFYFDDFLGRNYLTALGNRADTRIVQFMKRVKKTKGKRFVLTSRTNIFNEGRHLSIHFDAANITKNEFEIRIESLTSIDKAQILYNHIWHGSLSRGFIGQIYKDRRYLRIISHKNFNPRLISFITDSFKISDVQQRSYWNYVERTLQNPIHVWAPVFDVQISECQRTIVYLIAFFGKRMEEDTLKKAYARYLRSNPEGLSHLSNEFESQAKGIVGSLINRNLEDEEVTYNLFNPSVGDFIISKVIKSPEKLISLPVAIREVRAFQTLKNLEVNRKIGKQDFDKTCVALILQEIADWGERSEYTYALIEHYIRRTKDISLGRRIGAVIKDTVLLTSDADGTVYFLDALYELIAQKMLDLGFEIIEPCIDEALNQVNDYKEFEVAARLINLFPLSETEDILRVFEDCLETYWKENAQRYFQESGRLDEYNTDQEEKASQAAYEHLSEMVGDYGFEFPNLNVELIIDSISFADILKSWDYGGRNLLENTDRFDGERKRELRSEREVIEDLFDRSGH